MTTIKDTDLFVVQAGVDDQVYNYSGEQLKEDINLLLAERDVKVWVQSTPPPTPTAPDYASQKDLWYDTSIGAFFIGALDDGGGDPTQIGIVWIIVNPADRRKLLDSVDDEVVFPKAVAHGETFLHPNNGVTYHFKSAKSQWMDKDLPGLDTFVLREGDTMTGALQLPNLIVTGDDTVEAHIELNEGLLTADDSVVGEEQRLYWNGDTVAKHEDVVTLTNSVINTDQHIENITPYAYRGLLRNDTVEGPQSYVLYDKDDVLTDTIVSAEKVFLSDTGVGIDGIDAQEITNGMYIEIQAVSGTDLLTGKVIDKLNVTGGAKFTLDVTRAQGTSTVGDISHVRIFSVADSSAKSGVYYEHPAPDENVEVLKAGQLWVDSKTNIQYIWTGEEWVEVGAACGSGGGGMGIPVGIIWPYAGNITADIPLPAGWLLCDGSDIDPRYKKLVDIVGTKTPDLRGRYLGGYGAEGLDTLREYVDDSTRKPRNSGGTTTNERLYTRTAGSHNHTFDKQYLKTDVNANTNSAGIHNHEAYMGQAGSGKSHDNGRGFADTSNNNAWTRSYRNTTNGGQKYIKDSTGHSHGVSVTNATLKANNTNSAANLSIANVASHRHYIDNELFDDHTRPLTYAVHWIIKHD